MGRFWRVILFTGLGAALLTMFLCSATPDDWNVAGNIRCYEIEVLGTLSDTTPTTITEVTGKIYIEGDLGVESKLAVGGSSAPKSSVEIQDTNDVSAVSGYTDTYIGYNFYTDDAGVTFKRLVADNDVAFFQLSTLVDGSVRFFTQGDALATVDSTITPVQRWRMSTQDFDIFDDTGSTTIFNVDNVTEAVTIAGPVTLNGTTNIVGEFKRSGTAITATATELNMVDGSVAGTAVVNKALVLGTNKNVDTIIIADNGLKLGSGAGTAVTSTATELNLLDGQTYVNVCPYVYRSDNVTTGQNDLAIDYCDVGSGINYIEVPVSGSIVAMSIAASATVSAGSVTAMPSVDGIGQPSGCLIRLESGDNTTTSTTFTKGTHSLNAGVRWRVEIDTSADFAPTTNDIAVTVYVEH